VGIFYQNSKNDNRGFWERWEHKKGCHIVRQPLCFMNVIISV